MIIHNNWINWILKEYKGIKMNTIICDISKNPTEEQIKKIWEIKNEFQETVLQFSSWYSQVEIDSWETKIKEAEKVIDWIESEILEALCVEWELVEELANKILVNAQNYTLAYMNAEKTMREKIKAL